MAVFQLVFGLLVFMVTREYYRVDAGSTPQQATAIRQPAHKPSDPFSSINPALLGSIISESPAPQDPVEILRQANQQFANKQYFTAANLYEQLLALDPNSANTLNNLGLTLYYLGRSDEALQRLDEGIAAEPTYQRIWLTLGFVNSDLGNIESARTALATAAEIDPGSSVGRSAATMLEKLQ